MAVSVQINAAAGGAVDAIKQIQAAIERAGQSGREFAKLDLSHPELAGMADDIRRLAGRFEDLAKIGRGATATAYRGVTQGSNDPLMWDFRTERAFPDQNERERHRQSVLNYVTRGTRWAQNAPREGEAAEGAASSSGGAPASAAGGGSGGGNGGIGLGAMAAGALGGVAGFLAFKALGEAKDFVVKGVGLARDEATGTEDLYRHTDLSQNFNELRDAIMATTKGLGVTAQEAGALALSFAKITGETDPTKIAANVRTGIGIGRAYGIDPAVATQAVGQAANAGIDPRTFATLVGEAAAKGGRSVDETMPAMIRLAETSARAFVDHLGANLVQAGGMLAGLNAMKGPGGDPLPGMRNGGAERIMGQIGEGIEHPGGGPAGEAFLNTALRRQGVTNSYLQRRAREGGLFYRLPSGMTNVEAVNAEAMRQYPGQGEIQRAQREDAMENLLGTKMREWDVASRYLAHPEVLRTTSQALSDAGMNSNTLNPSAIADEIRISNAPAAELGTIRQQMLDRHGASALSTEDQQALKDTGPESLRSALLKMADKYGQSETEGNAARGAMAELSNSITEMSRGLLPPLSDLKYVEGELVKGVALLTNTISDVYKAAKGDPEAQKRLSERINTDLTPGADINPLGLDFSAPGDRKNNKLNLEFAGQPGAGRSGRFATFATPEAGIAAATKQLLLYQDRDHLMTLQDMITKWAPPKENDTESYIRDVSAQTHIDRRAPVNLHDPMVASRVVSAMGRHESGQPLDQQMVARGVQSGLGGGGPAQVEGQITVTLQDTQGNIIYNRDHPITQVNPPTPHGPPRKGDPIPAPPIPPARQPPPMSASGW